MHAWRIVLLPVLLACAIGLGTSHIGHAGLLSLHLATAHHDTPPPAPVDPPSVIDSHAVVHVAPSDEPHEHPSRGADAHEHPAHHASAHEHPRDEDHHHAADRQAVSPPAEERHRPIASAPHEHGGLIHTHDPRSDEELVLPPAPFSEFYVPASAASPPRVARSRSRTPWVAAALDQAVPSIESPPPQLPG
ncbi:MAG TPA: hypothetical protein VGB24_24740 [Longimicrobium sp.]|jgi:hypothetical protein|uniref:hypothetical protein n=1 Tax=Longimicrobium sp. TaxID=2029185 RepID=UPI002EDB1CBE